ncbi:CDK5 regulatory subunit-associated protein 2 isoform X6 [Takifugu flavidus]|uniref:CDK5 regulatory subunit-associated protein 2 isoform X6 n=1 Tax=Takifugu flavidus TaxID=433684 RepID=UPI00254439C2|nr:CDK5 regulatory subunit-associated protein 2 isoform X6 [Takifugu flavidus]
MRDPCRICGLRAVGSQCRWIFSSSAKRKLHVILSHVLGWEMTRDGGGEFLCGKCVFQLEKVVQYDVDLSQLQDEHNSQIQKLQAEKDHLIQCIVHTYSKNNPSLKKIGENNSWKTSMRFPVRGSLDDDGLNCQRTSEVQQVRKSRMKRCVSLDQISSKAAFLGHSHSVKSLGHRGSCHRPQSIYLDLVQRKGMLPRPGFGSRSTSLQSLNRDFSSDMTPDPSPRHQFRDSSLFVDRHGVVNKTKGMMQAKALLHRSSSQPSIISDLIQLLRCISKQKISSFKGSHIPILKSLNTIPPNYRSMYKHSEAGWRSLHDLTEEFDDQYTPATVKPGVNQLEVHNKLLTEQLAETKSTSETLTKTLEETQNQNKDLLVKLEEKETELNSEKKNALKRDKTIQGLTQVLKEKEKEIAELFHEIEDRDDALAKAREAAHKAQLQKYQGVEEHQNLLMEKQTELAKLQGEHNAKVFEAQKLQRALHRREQELADLQQAKDQLEMEMEDLQQQKKKGDKALNDLNNQLKKMSDEIGERESALQQQYQETLEHTKRKLQAHEVTIHRLTSTLSDKEQQLQDYMNMVRDFESRSPVGNDNVLSKMRQRLKDKEKALEQALDEKFAAIEEKDNVIHQLQLSLRERERDLERLNNLISHNEETINSFDSVIKEKDVELQHLANTLKNLQRAKQDVEDNLNRSLREKDSIISQLQLSLEGKTKDMEEMAESVLNQSQTHARDLIEQMGQRLKFTEAMLAEAVKARERLVADNESAVEGLLATISSKDQLLKESAEHYNRLLSDRTQEIQELRKQLSNRQQQLTAAERHNSTTAQEGYLETAELRALLAEKDGIINKLLHRGQDREQFLADMQKDPDHVLELKHTIQIMQEHLDERDAELSKRISEDNMENLHVPQNTVILLKKELSQKTEALNKALQRESELKISLAELQSLLSEMEGRNEAQAANIESLTATLNTKDDIINTLHQRFSQRGGSGVDQSQDPMTGSGIEGSLPSLPQRETTMIGGDSQQEVLPKSEALQQEHDALYKALRAEQQLYSSLVRTVKEQDSTQRLHALQLELTSVQLLREQLEESIRNNKELRDDLESEIQRAKLREGVDAIDPKELESMKHQLEDAQRWNASLQARLGAIQNRGGGVGGARDSGDTLSFIGDQTSYMSICVGEEHDESLSELSAQELRHKVLELQDCVSNLQTLNNELQNQLSLVDKSDDVAHKTGTKNMSSSPWKQQLKTAQKMHNKGLHYSVIDKECQTDIRTGEQFDVGTDEDLRQSREDAHSASDTLYTEEKKVKDITADVLALESLLTDCGATSVSHLRETLLRLRRENAELRGLLKEQKSAECKEKESADASGDSSDGQAELRRSLETLQSDSQSGSSVSDGSSAPVVSSSDGMVNLQIKNLSHRRSAKQHVAKHRAGLKSRLPVPLRLRGEASSNRQTMSSDLLKPDPLSNPLSDDACVSDQQLHTDADGAMSSQYSTSPSSTLRYSHRSCSPVGSDKGSDASVTLDHTYPLTELELLHQECQEKEVLINKLSEQLADWEELQSQLQEKDQLNHQYMEALQAAESTIAYLTACSLDSQEQHVAHNFGTTGNLDINHYTGRQQNGLWEQCRPLTGNQDRPRVKDAAAQHCHYNTGEHNIKSLRQIAAESLKAHGESKNQLELGASDYISLNPKMTEAVVKCLSAIESAVASLAEHCTDISSLSSGKTSQMSSDLQVNLDNLQRALQDSNDLGEATQFSDLCETKGHIELHNNLCHLYKVFGDKSQRISELQASLQEQKCRKEDHLENRTVPEVKGLPPSVKSELETLHKALREKKKACKSLEERLATALTNTTIPENAQKALKQDDKGVQVDLQDLGYETSGKSEQDREECSSTDFEAGLKPSCSASSLPTLLKHEQATFSSTENLDSSSSTPYPSSPALSSAKVSQKSLQVYNKYGVSEDPLQLQGQVGELKAQLENQTKVILQMQSLLHQNSLSSDLEFRTSDPSCVRDLKGRRAEEESQEGVKKEGDKPVMNDKSSHLSMELERERAQNRRLSEQLQQTRSGSTSPARLDSLVQSQARELSQLRQQIKESRKLGALQRQQLEELNKAFKELLHANKVDCYMGEVVKEQLDKSLGLLDRLEGRLDRGDSCLDNGDVAALELSRSLGERQPGSQSLLSCEESMKDPPDSPCRIQQELDDLRMELEGEREVLQQHTSLLVQQNLTLAECTREQLDLLAQELQEKNCIIQNLESQLRDQSPHSQHSSHSDLCHSDRTSSSYSSPTTHGSSGTQNQKQLPDWKTAAARPGGGVPEEGVSGTSSRLQGLQRENGRLQEQLRSSEELNSSLRSELDLHRSVMAQTSSRQQQDDGKEGSSSQTYIRKLDREVSPQDHPADRHLNSDMLGEHLQEIRALRLRLEESIRTNDRLREQLEKKLAEVERDSATNIFIHGEERSQLANEIRILWGQNQALKEQLSMGSKDKQKENERLRETVARRTAKLEQSRKECEALRQENTRLQERLEQSSQETSQLQETLQYSKEELHRLQSEVNALKQQLSDSQHLLNSLRLELQVFEKMKTDVHRCHGPSEAPQDPAPSGSWDLSELLSEIRHLRLQLEKSIQTNTALREKLEEQLLKDEGGRSPGREGNDALHHSFHSHNKCSGGLQDERYRGHSELDGSSRGSSSGDSLSGAPSRLVPGHRIWANRNGRHILGLIEDYSALRKQISDGRKLSRSLIAQLQECVQIFRHSSSDNKMLEEQHLRSLTGSMNNMQHVLEEAGRLLKLVWRVSLPAANTAGDGSSNQQDELMKNELARLKSRLSQQERMLCGAVKRLRTTNQLKEGMEKMIIDQLYVTHGVLKKARGNLETNYSSLFSLKEPSGGPDEGGPRRWPVGGGRDLQPGRAAEDPSSDES